MTASTITIVTKNTPQSYTGGTTAAAKGTALSVFEVDSNFINLKEGIIQVETDLANWGALLKKHLGPARDGDQRLIEVEEVDRDITVTRNGVEVVETEAILRVTITIQQGTIEERFRRMFLAGT